MFDFGGKLGGATQAFPAAPTGASLFSRLSDTLTGSAPEMAGNTVAKSAQDNYTKLAQMGQTAPAQFSPVQFQGAPRGQDLSQFISALLQRGR